MTEKMQSAWMQYREDWDIDRLGDAAFGALGLTCGRQDYIRRRLAELVEARMSAANVPG